MYNDGKYHRYKVYNDNFNMKILFYIIKISVNHYLNRFTATYVSVAL